MTTREFKVVQTCWFTGVRLVVQDRSKNGADRGKPELPNNWSLEHIVPEVSHLIACVPSSVARRNTAPAAAYVNHCVGSLPLAIKFRIRERLRMAIHGTTGPVEPVEWTSRIKGLVATIVREEDYRYRLLGRKVYHNPTVNPETGARFWSLDNPHVEVTPEILAERERLLNELRDATLAAFISRFGIDTPEVREAIRLDLSHHLVPNGRNARKDARKKIGGIVSI